ncbi:RNA polymerase sigma factor (sigma-70 family) [Clostridium acetobutylicum]|uniref:Possible sigma factor n=1 Tax=Clostridium acetobutylicum (strain ATCC 824 / DSM 792 / JCM 1419 / IAM 19013 / LMG 5710 / NBRC 13948 / NRRL B-527 / VKM B-1787 / 2291 / W) TaxID=272562 RepID=Q97LK8_CLOAB|nr:MULTISPECIES: sigma factor-like helix-turn-helix DNA-binding protein [Clostridium]AAK78529.1 Possible sigma factor [Clostridium acetobutylicum ATCC 824]ADZ19602.1 putative sigma factor [Clostridium acetobutylicum EA 2018]AEI31303.1 RNA polymerase sigma factor [Clostridium acetobutylicum DSM 1731]AWV80251.1 RNA polymerase subunit sigma [Clostridium acetobutylicum]MBC2392436.1 RNA polymerase subunit sigma [Clostridium acetobutylicum]
MRNGCKEMERLLWDYRNIKAEIKNLELEIEASKENYEGLIAVSYKEKTAATNKFNSVVENEVLTRENKVLNLEKRKRIKEIQIEKVDNAIDTLSDNERRIIELRYFYRLQFKQISERLNLNETYCMQLKSKTLYKLETLVFI